MVCASLRDRGDEFVAWPRIARAVPRRADDRGSVGASVGQPPRSVAATGSGAARVDLAGDRPPDGSQRRSRCTATCRARRSPSPAPRPTRAARASPPQLDYGARPDLLRAFPFPHVVTIDARLDDRRAAHHHRDRTDRSRRGADLLLLAPVSPHPRVAAPRLEAALARCERVLVDERVLPTGERSRPQPAEHAALGDRTFDDHYRLGSDRRFSLAAGGRTARPPVRPDLSVRAALRAAARRLRRDRTDDRDDRRTRPAQHADGRTRRALPSVVHDRVRLTYRFDRPTG